MYIDIAISVMPGRLYSINKNYPVRFVLLIGYLKEPILCVDVLTECIKIYIFRLNLPS